MTALALTPTDNSAFLREVDEELRRDRTEQFVRRWGTWIAIGVILLLAAAGGYLWWQNSRVQRAGADAEAMTQAVADLQSGGAGEAKGRAALQAISDKNGGYGAAARLTLADLAMTKGDLKAAAAAYSAIAADTSVAQPFRDLALVRQTAAEFDALPPATVQARLGALAVPGNPWFGSAGEMVAVAALRQGRRAEAARIFASLGRDQGVPATIRSRAVQMAGVLGAATGGGTAR